VYQQELAVFLIFVFPLTTHDESPIPNEIELFDNITRLDDLAHCSNRLAIAKRQLRDERLTIDVVHYAAPNAIIDNTLH
jgi:hypothetical protein